MGQSKPIARKTLLAKDSRTRARCGSAWLVYDQYRVNQPHDRASREVGLS